MASWCRIVHRVRKVFSSAIWSRAVNQSTDHWLHKAVQCNTMLHNTIQCNTILLNWLHNAIQWYTMQYNTMQCYSTDHWLNHRWVIPPLMPQFTHSLDLKLERSHTTLLHWREVTQVRPVQIFFILFYTSNNVSSTNMFHHLRTHMKTSRHKRNAWVTF